MGLRRGLVPFEVCRGDEAVLVEPKDGVLREAEIGQASRHVHRVGRAVLGAGQRVAPDLVRVERPVLPRARVFERLAVLATLLVVFVRAVVDALLVL